MRKLALLLSFILIFIVSCTIKRNSNKDSIIQGVWWWNKSLGDEYLEFAKDNNINEIYYCDYEMNDNTYLFAQKCKRLNIKVYILLGEWQWVQNPEGLYSLIEKYKQFQIDHKNILSGIHLDIEPHQSPSFSEERNTLLTKLCTLAYNINNTYKNIDISYDIPFWIDDIVEVNGVSKKAYEHMLDYSDKCFIMSYRDTKEKIYDVASDEMKYARENNKHLILGVETYSTEGDQVSFLEEGKEYLNTVLNDIKGDLDRNVCGISIHQIKTWYSLI